jgi:hypothetical protein
VLIAIRAPFDSELERKGSVPRLAGRKMCELGFQRYHKSREQVDGGPCGRPPCLMAGTGVTHDSGHPSSRAPEYRPNIGRLFRRTYRWCAALQSAYPPRPLRPKTNAGNLYKSRQSTRSQCGVFTPVPCQVLQAAAGMALLQLWFDTVQTVSTLSSLRQYGLLLIENCTRARLFSAATFHPEIPRAGFLFELVGKAMDLWRLLTLDPEYRGGDFVCSSGAAMSLRVRGLESRFSHLGSG